MSAYCYPLHALGKLEKGKECICSIYLCRFKLCNQNKSSEPS